MELFRHLREKIPWFPTINDEACIKDLKCLNFCPHDVFEWDPKTGRPLATHPLRCLPGCEICLEGCDTGAISLPTPDEFRATLERMRRADQKPPALRPVP
jgi:NAD-dependent dihydropyrimidine dehydrogenase PreA subunit